MMAEYVEVVFRKYNGTYQDIIALFPDIIEKAGKHNLVKYYMLNGDNGYCRYRIQIGNSKPATPEEYKSLHSQIEALDYNLIVIDPEE